MCYTNIVDPHCCKSTGQPGYAVRTSDIWLSLTSKFIGWNSLGSVELLVLLTGLTTSIDCRCSKAFKATILSNLCTVELRRRTNDWYSTKIISKIILDTIIILPYYAIRSITGIYPEKINSSTINTYHLDNKERVLQNTNIFVMMIGK